MLMFFIVGPKINLGLIFFKKAMSIAKGEAKKLIDRLPDHATWDDI
jgi:hypothetical protein